MPSAVRRFGDYRLTHLNKLCDHNFFLQDITDIILFRPFSCNKLDFSSHLTMSIAKIESEAMIA